MKAGIKTTEFWLAMIVALAGALAVVYADAEWAKVAGMVAAALASAGYGFTRAKTKVADLEERGYTERTLIENGKPTNTLNFTLSEELKGQDK